MTFPIRPILDYVWLEDLEDNKKVGSIFLVKETSMRILQGRVVAIGDGVRNEDGSFTKPGISVGDKVCYAPYAVKEVVLGNKTYWVLREKDVLCAF